MDIRFTAVSNGISFEVDITVVEKGGILKSKTFTRTVSFRN